MTSTRTGLDDPARQDATAAWDGAPPEEAGPLWAPRVRGRHRRPRPRKVLFAAGGLALAAGMLSLVRLTPHSGDVTGIGAAEAESQPDPVTDTATDTDASTGAGTGTGTAVGGTGTGAGRDKGRSADAAVPGAAAPTAPTAMGGASARPTPGVGLVPGTPGSATSVALTPGATYTPVAPHAQAPAPARTAAPRPTATPTPSAAPTTAAPAPQPQNPGPGQSGQPGVCVPVVGLCVDPLGAPVPKL
ncbi:hypothetical protein [Streptomyces sp. 3214.6]|uniref:hypothetical protein n=1 Tax=Streptomyces sp. 3214.6 TaxID=1882757 RepID=UPI000909989E|nr:hypothetical protein [Streptomyces sp. 3214.6]SHI02325.1 hypothetical protein SAMN05444521_3313 [Streptomyces sp. 3214.6]